MSDKTEIWTRFHDHNTGGTMKTTYREIYIRAPVREAKVIFYDVIGHDPEKISCECCGEDFTIDELELSRAELLDLKRRTYALFMETKQRKYKEYE